MKKVSYKIKIRKLLEYFSVVDLAYRFSTSTTIIYFWKAGRYKPHLVHKRAIDELLPQIEGKEKKR